MRMEYTEIADMIGCGNLKDFDELVARGKSFAEIDRIITELNRYEAPERYGNYILKEFGKPSRYMGGI